MTLKIREICAKTALNPSGIKGFTYCLNPYIGCIHGCIYCYATFMKRFRNYPLPWGRFVDVKINFADILRSEVKRRKVGLVAIGTVCDPYQPYLETKYQLTRQSIEILSEANFPFQILTKSDLVVRDIEYLKQFLKIVSVELTITTLDETIRRIFEPNATSVEARLETLKKLLNSGIETAVFFGPVIPYFSDSAEHLKEFFSLMQKLGVRNILVDRLNYLESKIARIIKAVGQKYPQAVPYYRNLLSNPLAYNQILRQRILEIVSSLNIAVEVLF